MKVAEGHLAPSPQYEHNDPREMIEHIDADLADLNEDLNPKVELSDLGNAQRAYDIYGSRLRYATDKQQWLYFDVDRGIWCSNADARVHKWMRQTVLLIRNEIELAEGKDERNRVKAHALASQAEPRITAAIRLLRFLWDVPVTWDQFDRDCSLLTFSNGTYDAKNNELRKPRREDMITRRCPTMYDPTIRSSIWESFMDQITLGNDEYARFLQRSVGYSIFGDNAERVVFFVHGEGATGKSTFLDAIRALLGPYAATVDPVTFMKTRTPRTGHRSDLVRLANTRLVVTDEVEVDSSLAVALVKRWCGGDTIVARTMYKEEIEFDSRGVLWINSNHCPKVSIDDEAAWDRIIRLPFENRVPRSRQNPDLKRILCDKDGCCLAGLATWAIEGWQAYQKQGLGVPDIVKKSTAEYKAEQSGLHEYIRERLKLGVEGHETVADVYNDYELWCDDIGIDLGERLTKGKFGRELKAQHIDQTTMKLPCGTSARVWLRVGFKRESDGASEPALDRNGSISVTESATGGIDCDDNDLPF
jgi:putative DNA primase/helicase